ncbi:MAG: dihydrodipicolinate synthase family protein [Alphaproteobacteria bacterium]|jgi:4-hydroxy-tetrahydrodipicolinate synthase|nr:dihydrodipicolinate synthase family protein [Alphaproteobacteria bacterium]MDP6516171.1 dihydrodipicolinate synthase family protein [Alphaproteobacteria bacterium]
MPQSLKGVFCPTLTPVDRDLEQNLGAFIGHCRRLLDEGCHGLAVYGTTSEANSFSVEERMAGLEALVEAGLPAARIIPGTGCCALTDSVRLTAHAVRLGCAGVLMLPPFYYKGVGDDGLFKGFAEVIERVGDDRLRVYLYHIPPVSSVPFSLALVERLVGAYPETVIGLKDSSGDWSYTDALLRALPGFGAFSGSEVFLLANLRAGGVGCITASANVNAPAIRRLYDHWSGADADAMQEDLSRRRQIIQASPLIPSLKRILAHHLGDEGWCNLRPPLMPLDAAQAARLIADLDGDGFAMSSSPASTPAVASA